MIGPHLGWCDAARSFPPTTEDDCHCSPVPAPVEPLNDDGHTEACSAWKRRFGWSFCEVGCVMAQHVAEPERARLETLAA